MSKFIYDFEENDSKKRFYLIENNNEKTYIPFYKIQGILNGIIVEEFEFKCWKSKSEMYKMLDKLK